jgi:hypothetical protein
MWWQTTDSQRILYFTPKSFFMNNLIISWSGFHCGGIKSNHPLRIRSKFTPHLLRKFFTVYERKQ